MKLVRGKQNMNSIQERLNSLELKLRETSFQKNKGLGNEVGYYVFDYSPSDELLIRRWASDFQKKIKPAMNGYELVVFDIYDIMINIIEKEGYLQQCFDLEKKHGIDRLVSAMGRMLRLSDNSGGLIVDFIKEQTPVNAIVFIIGVGKSYPVLRSHKILNNLHQVFDIVPVILFYPGKYDGRELILFETIKDDNYYRAFKLI